MPATIIAFDGALFDTLPVRRAALVEALHAEGVTADSALLDELLPGRTLDEVVRELSALAHDPTRADLVMLRAQRLYAGIVAHGASARREGLAALRDAQRAGHRVVVRADSDRRHVEALLSLSGLESEVGLLRCADDPPRRNAPSLERSWQAIDERLTRLGIPVAERVAVEAHGRTLAAAGPFVLSGTTGSAE